MAKRGRPKKLSAEWVGGRVLRERFSLSDEHLRRLRQEKLLKEKQHWINIALPSAARPTYRYHLNRCEAVFEAIDGDREVG